MEATVTCNYYHRNLYILKKKFPVWNSDRESVLVFNLFKAYLPLKSSKPCGPSCFCIGTVHSHAYPICFFIEQDKVFHLHKVVLQIPLCEEDGENK